MIVELIALVRNNSQLLLFILLALGYLFGRIRIGGLQLGAAPGILIAGLIFGHFQFHLFPGTGSVGILCFFYAVAFQCGPNFFSVVLAEGGKYISLAAIVTFVGLGVAYGFSLIFHFEPGMAVGLMSGALTSPPALAAAIDAVNQGDVFLPPGVTAAQMIENINISYAITFLFGVLGVVLFFRASPKWLGFNLHAEAVKAAQEKNVQEEKSPITRPPLSLVLRAYQINHDDFVGKRVKDLEKFTDGTIQLLKRGDGVIDFKPDTKLELGDRLSISGLLSQQEQLRHLLGSEIGDPDLLSDPMTACEIIVTKAMVIGKPLETLEIDHQYGCYLTQITRSGVNLKSHPGLILKKGDILAVSGLQSQLNALVKEIGLVEANVHQTDLLTFASGIILGYILGGLSIKIAGIPIGLGTSGGVLTVGLVLGYFRSLYPTFGRIPPATLWIFRELGLLLFLADTGVVAGEGVVEALKSAGIIIVLCGVVVSTLPIVVGYFYGIYVLKMNRALLLGTLTGAVASTPAMVALSTDARNPIPEIGYSGSFPFALIFAAIAGSIMARL